MCCCFLMALTDDCFYLTLKSWWGVFKGLIAAPFTLAIVVTANLLLSIFLLPLDVCRAYISVCATPYIGRNVKFFCILLLPIPLIIKPLMVVVASILGGFFAGFKGPIASAFAERKNPEDPVFSYFCGFDIAITDALKLVHDTYNVLAISFFGYLDDFRTAPPGTIAFDIPFYKIPVGIFVAFVGIVFDTASFSLLAVLKTPFGICYQVVELWRLYCGVSDVNIKAFCLPCFLVVHLFIPLVAVVFCLGSVLCGIYNGISCAEVAYMTDSAVTGIRRSAELVLWFGKRLY